MIAYVSNYALTLLDPNCCLPPEVKLPRRHAIYICGICEVFVSASYFFQQIAKVYYTAGSCFFYGVNDGKERD